MKKIYSLLLLAVALVCMPFWVKAETVGPLYDGTNKYGANIPLEGNSADYFQRVQVIYPKSDLSAMAGKNITKMTFYLTSSASKVWGSHAVIRLAETEDDSFTTTSYKDGEWTVVYDGNALDATGSTMEVVFATPFYFSGEKNLLFELQHPEKTGSYAKATFAAKGGYDYNYSLTKVLSYGTFESITTGTQRNVLPKTTFTYEEAGSASCAKPTLTPGDVTAKTAAFSWTAGGEETQWQYVCLPATEKVNWEGVPTTTNTSATVENLAANTAYKFYLRAYCGAEDQSGDVSASFTTLKSCYEPTNLSVSNETIEGATISWSASGKGETQYQYTYAVYGGEANWEDAVTTSELSATLSGLNSATPYQVWVRSYCGAEDQSEAITQYFTTLVDCSAKTLPLNEDFSNEDNIQCWKMVECVSSTGVTSGEFAFSYTSAPQYLITPELTASAKQIKVELDYRARSTAYPESFKVGYSTTTNDKEEFTWLDEVTNITNTSAKEHYSEILPIGVKYIAIQCTSINQWALYIDNFSATEYEAPKCPAPKALAESEIKTTSAQLAWTKGGEETAWKLQTSADGENWNAAIDVTENPYTLSGLTENTLYYVRVAANCGEDISEYTTAISFRTECAVKTLPFSESFADGLPSCWSASAQWAHYNYNPFAMRYTSSANGDLVLPAIELNDLAQLTFKHQSSYTSCSVILNDGENHDLGTFAKTGESYKTETIDLSDYVGKTVTITIRGNYYSGSRYLYIDDVKVDYAPVATPTEFAAVAGNASATISWAAAENLTWNLQYRAQGDETWKEVNGLTTNTYALEGLVNGVTYDVKVQAVASANRKSEWAAATVTPEDCPNVTSVSFGAQTYNSIVVNWATSSASNCDVRYKAGEGDWTTVSNIAETTKTLTGLTTGAVYTVQVKPSCGNADSWVAAAETYTPAYSTPANAAVASITDNGASASWEAVADAPNGYKYIVVVKDATPEWASATATNELSAALAGLDAAVEYDFYVAAVYGEILGDAAKVSFKTVTVAPKNLTLSAVTATTATLTWEYEGAATAYEYAVGDDPDALEWNGVAEMTKILEGLTANTSYTFYVRAKYSDKVKSDSVNITFQTDCNAIAELPWFEGFEDMAVGNYKSAAPACWAQLHVNDGLPYAYVNNTSTYVKTGSKSMYVIASSLTDGYLILPAFEAALNGLQISFSHKEESATKSTVLTLGYITDIANAETFVAIQEFGRATKWQEEKEISLASIPNEVATTARLAFKLGKATDQYYTGIDDITVAKLPSCRKPVLGETTILPDGATFTWTAGNGETNFQYAIDTTETLVWKATDAKEATIHGLVPGNNYNFYVRAFCDPEVSDSVWTAFAPVCNAPTEAALTAATTNTASFSWTAAANITTYQYVVMAKGVAADWSKAKTTTNTTAEWTELAANTAYDFYVRSFFNESVQSAAASLSFRTECAAVAALPWSENFEDQTLNAAPACWEVIDPNNTNIYVSTGSTWFSLGTTGLFFEGAKANYGYILLPEFEAALNTLQISFSHSEESSSSSGKIELGYYKDGEFTSLKAYDQSQKAWKAEGPFALTDVPAGARLAFGYKTNSNAYAAAIDNITIEEIPACAVPTGLAASEVTATTATLSWTSEAANFKVQYTTDKGNWGEEHAVAAKTLALEGLTEQTTYYARVKTICGEASESEYCAEISFTTPCAAKAMPYAESFEEGVPACWETTGTWTTNSEYAHSGNALRADVKNKVATLTMPAIAISEADAELVFYVRNVYGGSSYVSGEVIITPTEGEAKHIGIINSNDINNKQKVALSEFNGKDVVISFSISSVSSTAYVYIDDVTVAKKQCAIPTNVKASAGDSKADVEWTAGEDEEAWQVRYKATAAGEWKEVEGTIATTSYSITGLSNGTQYEVQVRAYCDETHQSEWTAPVTFTPSEPTGFEHINGGDKAVKVMKNGVLYIIRDGVQYNAQGARVMDN